jgi:hypothetical protein
MKKTLSFVLISLIILSCDDGDSIEDRLSRIEANSYTGYVLYTKFAYDRQGRIVSITQNRDNDAPSVITVSYNGNEAVILSSPDYDPVYTQSTTVYLTLDATGLTQKRIAHTHKVPANSFTLSQTSIYDTTIYEYDGGGFLKKYQGSRYDSSWGDGTRYSVRRMTSVGTFTTEGGNVIALDEFYSYPGFTRNGDEITYSGGSSEYHKVFGYAKSYPNKTDFRNAGVLNEYRENHEAFLNRNYNNMPDQVLITSTDRDMNGIVIFNLSSTKDMERIYGKDGLLSSLKIPKGTQFRQTNYFYQ